MNITFAAIGSEQLAISLLSGIAKREGHAVSLVYTPSLFHDRWNLEVPLLNRFFDETDEVIQQIVKSEPDVLAFSVLTATYQWALHIATEVKKKRPRVKTIFGGVHISAVPDRVIKKEVVDYLVVGEGEEAFPAILSAIQNKSFTDAIANTWFKAEDGRIIKGPQKGFYQELDTLPAFDKILWENDIKVTDKYMTMASRGCPYRCSFCFNNFFARLPEEKSGKYVRFRSPDHMLAELSFAKERYGNIRLIDFQDDVFTADKKWLKEFLPRYKNEIDIPFQCLTHPKYLDEEIAALLSDAGCKWIQMGVQSMDEDFKKNNLQRFERSDQIAEACRIMAKYGIKAKLDHMFGLPEEPVSAQEKALALYKQYVPERIQTFWTCYLPGTDLLKEGLAKGVVTPEAAERLYEGIDFFFYRNEDNIKNPELVKTYKRYEFIFKILPIVPGFIGQRLRPENIKWIPLFVMGPVAYTADVITGFMFGNPDFATYARHYMLHIRRHIAGWFTSTKSDATKNVQKKVKLPVFIPKRNMQLNKTF
ncbi:MAG: radical SAM protein [Chitinophagales bacterium]